MQRFVHRRARRTRGAWSRIAFGLVVFGCGRFGYELHHEVDGSPSGSGGDAGRGFGGAATGAGGEDQAGAAGVGQAGISSGGAAGCTFSAFDAPEELTGLSLSGELWGPALSADGLTLYFWRMENGQGDLFAATRVDSGVSFSAASELSTVSSTAVDANPFVTGDGLTLYFASSRAGTTGDRDVVRATRPDSASSFSSPGFVAELNTPGQDSSPSLTGDELTIVLESDRPGGVGNDDIWMAERASRGEPFAPPVDLGEVNSPGIDSGPSLSPDGLTLFISSDRDQPGGDRSIFVSTRSDRRDRFSTPARITELDAADSKHGPDLRGDGAELLYSSNRSGARSLWRATRHCL